VGDNVTVVVAKNVYAKLLYGCEQIMSGTILEERCGGV
jgi:hypothetical protein